MVYLPTRAVDSTCKPHLDIDVDSVATISACQEEARTPYCWPPNGSRVCWSPTTSPNVRFYWPRNYYNSSSSADTLSVWYLGREISIRKIVTAQTLGSFLHPDRFLNLDGIDVPSGSSELKLHTTITLFRQSNDSNTNQFDFQGPEIILVNPPSETPPESEKPPLTTGQIVGTTFGGLAGLVVFVLLLYSYCQQCCLTCCDPGTAETKRVRAAERRRVREERASVQPDVDAIKAAVTRGEIWNGPVRPGGVWATAWPASPGRVARPPSAGGDDEIRVMGADEVRWMEEQRTELRRLEDQRREEQRVAERTEVARVEEVELPAYEAPPPKYTP